MQSVFGNTQLVSALSGDALEGPGRIIQGALTLAAAGLEVPASAESLLPNSLVSGWIGQYGNGEQGALDVAARKAEHEHEEFAQDADRRVRTATRRGGRALPTELRERLEQNFGGVDFSGVRLHTDGAATEASRSINARAFTLGQDIFFNAKGLNLASRGDQELLLHELTHVVQHLEGRLKATSDANTTDGGMAVSSPTDHAEREAVSTAASLLPSFDAPSVDLAGPVVESYTAGLEAPVAEADQAARSVENPNSNEASSSPDVDPTNTRTDGSVQEQKQSDQVEAWRKDLGMALGRIEAFQKQLEAWDTMAEPEQDKLSTEILAFSLTVISLALSVLETAMDFQGEGITFGSKLMAVGALTAMVAGALGESASLDTLKGENKQEDAERADDPTDARFENYTAWVLEGEGKVGDISGKPALMRVLQGGVRMTELLDGFMGWLAAQRVEKADKKEPPTKREKRLKSQAEDDKGDQQKQLEGFKAKVANLREIASRGGPMRGDRGDQEAANVDEEPQSVQTADAELSEAEKHGLEPAVVSTKGAVLRNDRRALRRTWVARLDAGTQLGFEAPMREWVRVLVLDGDHKGKWGFVTHHGVMAKRKEPGRKTSKDERGETQHRHAAGPHDRNAPGKAPKGGGKGLPSQVQKLFRPILGEAVDKVKIHTDGEAAGFADSVAATAVTVGQDIFFGGGEFRPDSQEGLELLAEELHHAAFGGGQPGVSQPGDTHERQAGSFAEALARGGLVEIIDNLLGDSSEDPSAAHGHVTHPRRALQAIKGNVPTHVSRHLGDALGVSQGTGLQPGAPGVGVRELGVGGMPRAMRPPAQTQPKAVRAPRKDVANRSPSRQQRRVEQGRTKAIDDTLKAFDNIQLSFTVETHKGDKIQVSITIETPYRINYTSRGGDTALGQRGYPSSRLPRNKTGSPDNLTAATTNAKLGKGTPGDIKTVIEEAARQGKISFGKLPAKYLQGDGVNDAGKAYIQSKVQAYLKAGTGRLIGVDCSGFVYQILTKMLDQEGHGTSKWIHGLHNTGTGNLKSDSRLTTVTKVAQLGAGVMLLHGRHVEMVRDVSQLSGPKLSTARSALGVSSSTPVHQVNVVESSPSGGREGPTSSAWVVADGKSSMIWAKASGDSYRKKTVKARIPDALGERGVASSQQPAPNVPIPQRNPRRLSRSAKGPHPRGGRPRGRPRGVGKGLSPMLLARFGEALGDLSQVRIHTDRQAADYAQSMNANAVTVGQDIYFNSGAFAPGSAQGDELLAEELHHAAIGGGQDGVSQPGDSHEQKAKAFAKALVRGGAMEALDRLGADAPAVVQQLKKAFGGDEDHQAGETRPRPTRRGDPRSISRQEIPGPDATEQQQGPPEEEEEAKENEAPPGTDVNKLLATAEESAEALKELEEPKPAEEQVCEPGEQQDAQVEVGEADATVNAEGPTLDNTSPDLETVSAPPEVQAQLSSAPGLLPIPSTAPKGLQDAVAGLISAAQFQKDAIAAEGEVQKGTLRAGGETQKAAIGAAVEVVQGNITADFNATRDAILAKGEATKAAIEGVRDAQKTRLDDCAKAQIERLIQGVADRKKQVLELGDTLATQAEEHGRNEATRLVQGTRDLASKALAIGEAKVKQFAKYDEATEIAATARKMARTVAQDMVDQGAETAKKAIEDGKALAVKLREDAKEHSQNFEVDEDAVSAINEARDEAKKGLDEGTTKVLDEVDKSTQEAAKGVEQGLTIALAEVGKVGASVNPAIDAAVRSACAAVDQAVSMAQAEVDKAVNQVVAATGSVHESREAEAVAIVQQVQEALLGGSSTVLSGIGEVGQAGALAVTTAGAEAVGIVASSETSITDQNAEVLRSFEENMDQTVQTVGQEFAASTDEGIAKITETCDGFVEKLDEALTEATDHLNKGYSEGTAEITSKVNETLSGMQTKLNELGPAITKQADEIEHASWWDKLCSAVGSFFRGFWKGLCNFLAGLWTVIKWLAVILVILVVLVVILAYFAPALLAGLVFLAIAYAGTALTVLMWVGIIAGVLLVCVSLYQNWQIWTDPNKSWEEKWEAAGTFAFDVVDAIGPEKFLKPFTGLFKGIKGLLGLGDAAADLNKAENLTDAGDVNRVVDSLSPPQGSGSVGKADDLDNLSAVNKLDDVPAQGAGKLDDAVDTSKLDDALGGTGNQKAWDDPTLTRDEFIQQYQSRYPDSDLGKDPQRLGEHFDAGRRLDPETGRLKVPPPKAPEPSGKAWDDPTLTRDEFIADYKAKYPNTSLDDAALGKYFDEGKRLHPDTGKLRAPEPKPSTPHGPSNKGWDDPSLTKEEFIADYRARYPDSDLAKDPDKLGSMYDQGRRMNPETGRLKQPEWTNKQVREWYSHETNKIPDLDEGWQKAGMSLEERARKASEIRHEARMTARRMMQNPDEVAALQARDLEKYGNPNGPSFDDLVARAKSKGKTGDEIYEDILGSSSRRSTEYDNKFNVDQPKGTGADGPDSSPGGGKDPDAGTGDAAAKADDVESSGADVDPDDYIGQDGLRYSHPRPENWSPYGPAHSDGAHVGAHEAYELIETANKVRHTAHGIEHAAHTVKHVNSAKGATERVNEAAHEQQEQGH